MSYPHHIMEDGLGNTFSSILLLTGIFLLLGLTGASLLGVQGLILAPMVIVSVLIFEYVTPLDWLLRLYRAEPVPIDHPVYGIFSDLCRRFGMKKIDLFYSRAGIINALTLGTGASAAIVLTLPLIERLGLGELEGVMAHEIAHVKNRDLRFMNIAQVATRMVSDLSSVIILVAFVLLPFAILTDYQGISLISIILAIASPYLSILMQMKLSRTREFAADLSAVEVIKNPNGLISALLKLEAMQQGNRFLTLFRRRTHSLHSHSLHSHPETTERVERLKSYLPNQPYSQRY